MDVMAARSLSIMVNFRFHRSTNAPATGLTINVGAKEKKPTSASAVASPVASQAHTVNAKLDMVLPSSENTWPTQTTVNVNMPVLRGFWMGFVPPQLTV